MMRQLQDIYVKGMTFLLSSVALLAMTANSVYAQCNAGPTEITGIVFIDSNQDGKNDEFIGSSGVIVNAIDADGNLADHTISNLTGEYLLEDLDPSTEYRIEFRLLPGQFPGPLGEHNKSAVRFASSGECDIHFGVVNHEVFYSDDPRMAITCFVQGDDTEYVEMPTIVSIDHNFNAATPGRMEADKQGTGSVWGLAYHSSKDLIYSASIVKQSTSLKMDPATGLPLHDAIYSTDVNSGSSQLFARVSDLGINVPALDNVDAQDCEYGDQVGRKGLGGIEISDDEKTLYVVNVAGNSVVAIDTEDPKPSTTTEITSLTSVIPAIDNTEEMYPFALKYYKNKLYVGFTKVKLVYDNKNENSSIYVVEYDLATSQASLMFTTNYNKGSWVENDAANFELKIQHWFTDIDFISDNEMVIALNDRKGNRFCDSFITFPDQKGDVLVAYNNNGVWTLESGGVVNGRAGVETSNGQGPGGGEFFGDDFFPNDASYHNETSLGSVHIVPGSGEMISAVFDPLTNVYSGGLHRYSTLNGEIHGAKELYTNENVVNLGKATGFGGLTMLEKRPAVEIGNFVWFDENKNGQQDAGERGIPGIELDLYNSNCELIASTTTDANGNYVFNSANLNNGEKLLPYNTYHVVFSKSQYNTSTSSIKLDDKIFVLTEANEGNVSFPEGTDSDALVATNSCSSFTDIPSITVNTGEPGSNDHNFDLGLTLPGFFDLALRKELVSSEYAKVNAQSVYKITVINQGELGAKNIRVIDYIPEGLRITPAINAGWTINDDNATYVIDELAAGESTEIYIRLFINPGFSYENFINYAEIESADDQFNKPGEDIDSTPDAENDDQGGEPFHITDNEVEDDGTIDEDDHDPAALNVFDLALTKKIVNAKSGYINGEIVTFEFTVINQGNVVAENIEVTDYLPEGFIAVSPSNWLQEGNNLINTIPRIDPGQRAKLKLNVLIDTEEKGANIINVAEISQAYLPNGDLAIDYDSDMDKVRDNDAGGDPFGLTDNEVEDGGVTDEDDQDPAAVAMQRYDLALIKTTEVGLAQRGDEVSFDITVINQGTITADDIEVVDYLPSHLEFMDSDGWTLDADSGFPVTMLSRSNGLLPNTGLAPGAEVTITINCRVLDSAPVGNVINEAEIVSCKDFNGKDRSLDDFDSTPDFLPANDAGGIINTNFDNLTTGTGVNDEDDHDPASLAVMSMMAPEYCSCLSNATATEPGQFVNVFEFTFLSGVSVVVTGATNAEQGLNPVGDAPDMSAYMIGQQVATTPILGNGPSLHEEDLGFGASVYSLEVISIDGQTPEVDILIAGSIPLTLSGFNCTYNDQVIEGLAGACAGTVTTYSVADNPDSDYEWTLSGGGTIVGPTDESSVEVEWDAAPGGPYELRVAETNAALCKDVGTMEISTGVSAGALACIGDATISLDSDCSMEVTKEIVLTSEYSDDNIFNVIVIDEAGNMLSEPVLTGDHIGQKMTVKIVDACSGNSCWTSLTVTDKLKPSFVEQPPLTVDCNVASNFPTPTALDNCGGTIEIDMISEVFTPLTCDTDFTTTVTRVFKATDANGNVSDEYTQIINLARVDVFAVDFPEERTVANGNPVYCQQFSLDNNGNPSPEDTGVPYYNGNPIYPYTDQYCGLGVDYTDNVIAPNGCVEKIMRTWTVFEWHCGTSNIETMIQEINIADQFAPEFEKPADFTVSTNQNECLATVTLPEIYPEDDCSQSFEVDIQYPDGFINNQNGAVVDLDLGDNLITYTVYDGCLNSSSQSFIVHVEDNTVPVMVCDKNTVISLKADGTAFAPASVFDDGSVTDCSPLTFEVKRMDNGSECNIPNYSFGEYVEFCCADVGKEVIVLLKATDEDGNSNTCMVTTVIQDKNLPELVVPDDVTIQCTTEYDLENLDDQFGEATATDNCLNATVTSTYEVNVTDCNVGNIVRTFVATDGNGQATGTQVIYIENDFLFDASDITWPEDYTTDEGCDVGDLTPENLPAINGYPVINSDACDMISVNYTDKTFSTSDDACFKIIRKYIVMDMCQMDLAGIPLTFEYDQTIVVTNSVAPEMTSSCEPVTVNVDDSCDEGEITLSASASDDCTASENLINSYSIDLENNGSFDVIVNGVGGDIEITETLPVGNHRIVYYFEDRCGNDVTCTQLFSIVSVFPPLAKCQDLAIELTPMDTDGDGELDAEMVFLDVALVGGGSESPCDFPITLSYDAEGDSTVATFDCFDLGPNTVTVYVTDVFGSQSSCTATVIVQDNNNVDICPTPEDCIVPPSDNLTITECVDNLEPETIGGAPVVELPCVCEDFEITYVDADISDPSDNCIDVERTYTVTFNCFSIPLEYTYVQTIKQLNVVAPTIIACGSDGAGMATNSECNDFVSLTAPQVETDCNTGVVITNDSEYATSSTGDASGTYPVGTTPVIYTITDACGNATTCSVTVVVDDLGAPVCNPQDITVTIPSSGSPVSIVGEDVDNGSADDCGTIVSYDVSPSTFDCSNLGDNSVVLTVTDQSGNTSTCDAVVTVVDEVAPICVPQDLEFTISEADGVITITGEDVDNGSVDECGVIVDFDVTPSSFTCENVGANTVTLTVTDDAGNTSQCTATVTINDGVAPLCAPQDITVTLNGSGQYLLDASEVDNGSSDVCGEGVNLAVNPSTFECSNLGDNIVTLTVTDDAGNSSQCDATVTVVDTIAPIAVCIPAEMVTITLFNPTIPVPISASLIDDGSFDACGEIVEMTVNPSSFTCDDIGIVPVVLTVTDNNGNVGTCETTVIVQDAIAPEAIAQDLTVTIEMGGFIVLDPLDIDNGSFDECGEIVNYMIDPDTLTCDNLGENTVVLKVTDNSGNMDTAEATVTVLSNETLEAVCQDITVFIGDGGSVTIEAADVDGGSMAPCGDDATLSIDVSTFGCNNLGTNPNPVELIITDNVTNEMDTCTALVTVVDTIAPTVTCPGDLTFSCEDDLSDPFVFGEPIYDDNCLGSSMQDTIVESNLNDCGLGTITRTYVVIDLSGNSASCTQTITVEVPEANLFTEANIVWPADTLEVDDCSSTDPEDLMSFPTIDTMDAICFGIDISFEDISVGMGTTCQDTIERTFTVVDTCQESSSFEFVQVIIIDDSGAPLFEGLPTDTLLNSASDICGAMVDLSGLTLTDCTTDLIVTNDSPVAPNDQLDASGEYPVGTTVVNYTAEDGCGNVSSFEISIVVEDTSDPIVSCIKVFPEIQSNLMATVEPEDYIESVVDNCSDSVDLEFVFVLDFVEGDNDLSDNDLAETLTFDCDDVGILMVVNVATIDEAGNFFVCGAQTTVQDPNNFCTSPQGLVQGNVETHYGKAIQSTAMYLDGDMEDMEMVENNGYYAFDEINVGDDVNLTPFNNEDPDQGLTTHDILLIQNHILGIQLLTSPYDIIAADADNNETINGIDLIQIQKVILGTYDEFPSNNSFRFIDAGFEFADPSNPFATTFPESAVLNDLQGQTFQDFVGVKVGDVNGSFQGLAVDNDEPQGETIIGNRSVHNLYLEDNVLNPVNGFVHIPVYSGEFENLQALEMTLETENLQIVRVIPGSVNLSSSDYRVTTNGLKVSWINNEAIEVFEGEELFTVVVRSDVSIDAQQELEMSNDVNEFYTSDADIASLRFVERNEALRAELYQNVPNPWTDNTTIEFNMVTDGDYTFNFYDIDGRLLTTRTGFAPKGMNTIELRKSEMSINTGVIVYEFISGNRKLTKRMMLME